MLNLGYLRFVALIVNNAKSLFAIRFIQVSIICLDFKNPASNTYLYKRIANRDLALLINVLLGPGGYGSVMVN